MQGAFKFCSICGTQNNLSAQFCQQCGASYEGAPPPVAAVQPKRSSALTTLLVLIVAGFGCCIVSSIISKMSPDKTIPSTSVGFASSPTPGTARTAVNTNCDRVASALAEVAMTTLGYDDVVGFCRDDGAVVLKFADLKRGQIIRTATLLEPLMNQAMKDSRTGPAMRQAEVSKVCITNGGILSREERCFYLH